MLKLVKILERKLLLFILVSSSFAGSKRISSLNDLNNSFLISSHSIPLFIKLTVASCLSYKSFEYKLLNVKF